MNQRGVLLRTKRSGLIDWRWPTVVIQNFCLYTSEIVVKYSCIVFNEEYDCVVAQICNTLWKTCRQERNTVLGEPILCYVFLVLRFWAFHRVNAMFNQKSRSNKTVVSPSKWRFTCNRS